MNTSEKIQQHLDTFYTVEPGLNIWEIHKWAPPGFDLADGTLSEEDTLPIRADLKLLTASDRHMVQGPNAGLVAASVELLSEYPDAKDREQFLCDTFCDAFDTNFVVPVLRENPALREQFFDLAVQVAGLGVKPRPGALTFTCQAFVDATLDAMEKLFVANKVSETRLRDWARDVFQMDVGNPQITFTDDNEDEILFIKECLCHLSIAGTRYLRWAEPAYAVQMYNLCNTWANRSL